VDEAGVKAALELLVGEAGERGQREPACRKFCSISFGSTSLCLLLRRDNLTTISSPRQTTAGLNGRRLGWPPIRAVSCRTRRAATGDGAWLYLVIVTR